MFRTIYNFELRQQFKRPFTWLFMLLMFAQGVYYMRHSGEYFSADKTYANAPAIMYTVLAGIGYISFILTAMLGGGALTKDLDYRTSSLLYTTQAGQTAFFWGRYTGAFSVLLAYNLAYLLGIIAYSFLPVANLGPLSLAALSRAVLLILLPNTFILFTLCFTVTIFTRSAKSAYAIVLTAMLFMIFGVSMYEANQQVVLMDPTCFAVLENQLKHLSPQEKNVYAPEFSGLLFYNRLIWMAVALAALSWAFKRFSFKRFSIHIEGEKKKTQEAENVLSVKQPSFSEKALPYTDRVFSLFEDWKMTFSLSWLEFKSVTRPFGFKIFLSILLIFYVFYVAIWQQQYYSAAPTLPVTIEVTGVTLPLSFYFLMFIIINTTELLFKNQTSGFWTISDALPVSSWVGVLSKVIAMLGVGILLSGFLLLLGVLVQMGKGYYNFELGIYLNDLFIRWLPKYLVYILLVVFFAGLTGNRYATHGLSIVFLVVSIILHEIDVIEQNRLNYMFSPGSGKNTDMNGNGIFSAAHAWYMSYWTGLAVALFSIGLWVWQRGMPKSLGKRFAKRSISPVLIVLFIAGISVFFFCGTKIYQTVNIDNKFQTQDEQRAEQALYEKTYKRYEGYAQPLIRNLKLDLDLFPNDRKLVYHAELTMKNTSEMPIDTLHVEWKDFSEIDKIAIKGYDLKLVSKDEVLRHTIYKLSKPVGQQDSVVVNISGSMHYSGFTNSEPQHELTFNGTFLSNDIIPFFGYNDDRELKANKYRAEYGLERLTSRLPVPEGMAQVLGSFASSQADRIHYVLNVSTIENQTVVAPGILQKQWKENGRNHFRFISEGKQLFDFYILSAAYAVKKQEFNGIDITAYYHPGHGYNVDDMIKSAGEAVGFLSTTLGDYPYKNIRIAERPRYDEDLFAYGNVLVLPENHGWIADIRRKEDLDYLRYITARLIAKQYTQQANLSGTQGYPLITESIPGYLALLQLKAFYGAASLQKHLEKNHDTYLKGRADEPNEEPVLLRADEEAGYVSQQKGSYILYRLSQLIGEKKVNDAIRSFLADASASPEKTSAGLFYQKLKAVTTSRHQAFLKSAFEGHTIFKPESGKKAE